MHLCGSCAHFAPRQTTRNFIIGTCNKLGGTALYWPEKKEDKRRNNTKCPAYEYISPKKWGKCKEQSKRKKPVKKPVQRKFRPGR